MGVNVKIVVAALTACAFSAGAAQAGLGSWSSEVEKDPFSGGQRVTVTNMSSFRSGVLIICDSSEQGLIVRIIPGFAAVEQLVGFEPHVEFAIDEKVLFGQSGETGSVGDNLAISQTKLSPQNAQIFVKAFGAAKKQIAIKDGISDRPQLMTARGSTKAGADLAGCMDRQTIPSQ